MFQNPPVRLLPCVTLLFSLAAFCTRAECYLNISLLTTATNVMCRIDHTEYTIEGAVEYLASTTFFDGQKVSLNIAFTSDVRASDLFAITSCLRNSGFKSVLYANGTSKK